MQIKPSPRSRRNATMGKPARYVAMCIPGRTEADAGSWFVYDREQLCSTAVKGRPEALQLARRLNATGGN